jgi:hypothetical protein
LHENERHPLLWQMDFAQRFRIVLCEPSSTIARLNMKTPYPTMRPVRTNTRISETLSITLREDLGSLLNVFLPKIHLSVLNDDILKINNCEIKLILCTMEGVSGQKFISYYYRQLMYYMSVLFIL